MPTRKRAAVEAVRLLPVPGAYINGEPAVEREVTPEEAERLLSYMPAAYVLASDIEPVEAEEPPIPATEEPVVDEPQE